MIRTSVSASSAREIPGPPPAPSPPELGATNCSFEPWVPLSALPGIVAAADLALGIFGRSEKARRVVPHKVFQSLGMRRTVITARTPAVEEFFAHGENIWMCDEPYAESLADAVIRLRSDAALRGRIAAAGYRTVKERFTPAAIAKAIREAVANRRGGRPEVPACDPEGSGLDF